MGAAVDRLLREDRVAELPALPAVLLALLRVSGEPESTPGDVERVIAQDATLTTRLLAAASSAVFSRRSGPPATLHGAVTTMGVDAVHTLAMTATVQQFFGAFGGRDHPWVDHFWRRALACAMLARRLARATGEVPPEEAYLAGLLHNVGQPILEASLRREYTALLEAVAQRDRDLAEAEREQLGTDHPTVGAEMLERWGIPSFLADAIRYHRESVEELRHAHPLVRIVALANRLIDAGTQLGPVERHAAVQLGDLGRPATEAIVAEARAERDELIGLLDQEEPPRGQPRLDPTHEALGHEARAAALLGGARRHLGQGRPLENIARCLALLFGLRHVGCLQVDGSGRRLVGASPADADPLFSELSVPVDGEGSLFARSLLRNEPLHTLTPDARDTLTVADRQVCARLGGDGVLCLPMVAEGQPVGVLAIGIRYDQVSGLLNDSPLLLLFAREAGAALLAANREEANRRQAVAHEVARQERERSALVQATGEPLTIMRNYLTVLNEELGADHPGKEYLRAVGEEMQRVTELMGHLERGDGFGAGEGEDVNQLLRELVRLARSMGVLPDGVRVNLETDGALDGRHMRVPGLRRMILDLLRAAPELLGGLGGTATVGSHADVRWAGRAYLEIMYSDRGPGLPPEDVRCVSDASDGEPGTTAAQRLLSVAAEARARGGVVTCSSHPEQGTRLQLLLPLHEQDGMDPDR